MKPESDLPAERGRAAHVARVATVALWFAVLGLMSWFALREPSSEAGLLALTFALLFAIVHAQWALRRWAHYRALRAVSGRMLGSGYISDLYGLPNRNYLLAELRREMAVSRTRREAFILLQFSFDSLEEVQARRGHEFTERAVGALVELLRRITRDSDFIAYLSDAQFVVLLNECTEDQAQSYLRRVPGAIAVSDGRQMYEVPLSARLWQYDLESIYATDVLAEVQDSPALKRLEALPSAAKAA